MSLFYIYFLIILNIFMPVICWGPLGKSAQDPTTIAEYISGKISIHNVNPSAHGLDGYAVYNHRISDLLDHPDNSVILQKLLFNRFLIITHFSSLDGWLTSGTVALDAVALVTLETTAVNGNYSILYASAGDANELGTDPDNSPEFQTTVKFSSTTDQTCYIISGDPAIPGGYGFKIVNNTLYAWYIDSNDAEQTQEITGITLDNWNVYRAVITAGTDIKFYVNGVLKHTLTANLPTSYFGNFFYYKVTTNADAIKKLFVQNALYEEDFFD